SHIFLSSLSYSMSSFYSTATSPPHFYTLSLHDALPILFRVAQPRLVFLLPTVLTGHRGYRISPPRRRHRHYARAIPHDLPELCRQRRNSHCSIPKGRHLERND